MLGRTHLAAAIFLSALFFSFYSFDSITAVFIFLVFIFASLFPDVDSANSILGRKVKLIGFLSKHRGFFHSIWALILFSLLFGLIFKPLIGFVFAMGFISHLILDAITKEGVRILGFRIQGPFRVGSILEHIFYLVLLLLSLFFIVM